MTILFTFYVEILWKIFFVPTIIGSIFEFCQSKEIYAHLQIANSQGVKERKLASTCVPLKEKIIKTKHIAILNFETILKISFCLLIQYCTDQLNCSSEQPSIQYMHYWQKWFPNWQIKYKLKPLYNEPQYSEFHTIVS